MVQLRVGYGNHGSRLGFLQLGHFAVGNFHGRFYGRGWGRREIRRAGRMTTLYDKTEDVC